jgi:hypothetical protein
VSASLWHPRHFVAEMHGLHGSLPLSSAEIVRPCGKRVDRIEPLLVSTWHGRADRIPSATPATEGQPEPTVGARGHRNRDRDRRNPLALLARRRDQVAGAARSGSPTSPNGARGGEATSSASRGGARGAGRSRLELKTRIRATVQSELSKPTSSSFLREAAPVPRPTLALPQLMRAPCMAEVTDSRARVGARLRDVARV